MTQRERTVKPRLRSLDFILHVWESLKGFDQEDDKIGVLPLEQTFAIGAWSGFKGPLKAGKLVRMLLLQY